MLVPPGDAESLARAILELLDDEPRRKAMADAGRRSAQRFTLENVMPNYVRALDPEAT
jgi:glycosyltransferase involved in cell wall biosynthesis